MWISLRAAALAAIIGLIPAVLDAESGKSAREALKPFNDLIGTWKAVGEPEGTPAEKQRGFWRETVSFVWRFQGDDVWIALEFQNGKHYKSGEIRYLPEKDRFRLDLLTKDGKKLTFEGQPDDKARNFVFERTEDAMETQRLTFGLVGDIRFKYTLDTRPEGRRLFAKAFQVTGTREGESFGTRDKQPECIVSGGLGTMTVSYKGMTYYVCCTGCRDEFYANPEKYIKEYQEKKAKERQGK
jgi:hypothetical protein